MKTDPETLILLLRGINVGGPTRSLPMKELISILEALDCTDIKTYIQSGNLVLKASRQVIATLAEKLSQIIAEASYNFV